MVLVPGGIHSVYRPGGDGARARRTPGGVVARAVQGTSPPLLLLSFFSLNRPPTVDFSLNRPQTAEIDHRRRKSTVDGRNRLLTAYLSGTAR
ncbi:hypothetical protein BHE74_00022564 [Ensete ventricosum]|nr:hypothetical protein GW17_00028585 [Ensete ventricosum]RWW69798.1 hypothetical protein BHE74_00022564 [Ensete ventricosum]